jgi:hypothetical protein
LQAKWHENLHEHMGQLCAELKAAREEYIRNVLGKRKRDEPDALLASVSRPHSLAMLVQQDQGSTKR